MISNEKKAEIRRKAHRELTQRLKAEGVGSVSFEVLAVLDTAIEASIEIVEASEGSARDNLL